MVAFTWVRDYFRDTSSQDKTKVHSRQSNSVKLAKAEPSQRLINIINLYDQAKSCEACFIDTPQSERADIFGGQPRWIGKHYFDEKFSQEEYPRVLVLLLRPGQLGGRKKDFDFNKYNTLMGNMKDPNAWNDLMELINADSRHWGKFDAMYKRSMDLDEDFTAFLNIGLCAGLETSDQVSLSRCFEKYSRSILELFQPNILFLNGQKVQKFYETFVSEASYSSSRKIIEKMLLSKKETHAYDKSMGPFFTGQPLKVQSYAARNTDISYLVNLGSEIKYLYPPLNGAKEKRIKVDPVWGEAEIIVALDFYYDHRLNIPDNKSLEIQDLSKLIRSLRFDPKKMTQSFRDENEVYLKLMEFAEFDNKDIDKKWDMEGKIEKEYWDKFFNMPEELKKLAKKNIKFYLHDLKPIDIDELIKYKKAANPDNV